MKKSQLITITEAVEKYRVPRYLLYELLESGDISGYRPGRQKLYIVEKTLQEYLKCKNDIELLEGSQYLFLL